MVWTPGAGGDGSIGFVLVTPLPAGFDEMRARGIELASLQLAIGASTRREAPWLLPGVKSTSYAVNMAAQAEARRRGADDALFLSLEGVALECPTSNIWFVEDGALHTPALELGILAGVTRETLIAAAEDAGMRLVEGEYPREQVAARRRGVHLVERARGDARRPSRRRADRRRASGGRGGPDAVRAPARRRPRLERYSAASGTLCQAATYSRWSGCVSRPAQATCTMSGAFGTWRGYMPAS